jgi:hypothetical protein
MPVLLLIYGGWPLAAYLYIRFQRRRPPVVAFGAAMLALVVAFFIGSTLASAHAGLANTQPGTLQTSLTFVLTMLWLIAPYVLVCIWWIRRLLRHREKSQNI